MNTTSAPRFTAMPPPSQFEWMPGPPTPQCALHKNVMRYVADHGTGDTYWWCDECAAARGVVAQ